MKATVLWTLVFFPWVRLGLCGTPFSEAVLQNQRAAVQASPELGDRYSSLNNLFGEYYRNYQQNNPVYFNDDRWPLQLAKECVEELARCKQEQDITDARIRAAAEKERPALEARARAFKDFPVPEPATTPFDADPQKRKEYLAAYQNGYRNTLITRRRMVLIICGKGSPGPGIEGSNAGIEAACRDHPESIATSGAPEPAPQPTAGVKSGPVEILIDLHLGH